MRETTDAAGSGHTVNWSMTIYSIDDSAGWPAAPSARTRYTVTGWHDAERDDVDPRDILRLIAANTAAAVLYVTVDGQPSLREYHATARGCRATYTVLSPEEPHEWLVFDLSAAHEHDIARFDAQIASLRWHRRGARAQLFERKASASASSRRARASRSSG